MLSDRHRFVKSVGVSLGSLIASGSLSGCGAGVGSEPVAATRAFAAPEWVSLRQCWLDLGTLEEDIRGVIKITEHQSREAEAAVTHKRHASHRALLDALVATGELNEPVAEQMQTAFEEAVHHLHSFMFTCYMQAPLAHRVRVDFLKQTSALSEVSADLDPETVAKARAAITQDMAYSETGDVDEGHYKAAIQGYNAGELKASPEAREAARLLTELLLGASE